MTKPNAGWVFGGWALVVFVAAVALSHAALSGAPEPRPATPAGLMVEPASFAPAAPMSTAAVPEPVAIAPAVPVATPQQAAETSCIACHGDPDLFEPEQVAAVEAFGHDVHADVGLSCEDCHGGNPDPALAEDMSAAMDESYGPNPYRGSPDPGDVPDFCGRCHSDATYMRRFNPGARVDQEQEYWTSQHGEALAAGDMNVATCTSCHGVHGISRSGDPRSMVYPTRVAGTCSTCHADVEVMAGYTLPGGQPVPVDQLARWRESVHAESLLVREDLSAPTCNDCHGNHGARPPGLDSVTFVCGQCHGREAEIFRQSSKRVGFETHNNEYLFDVTDEGCAFCHEAPEPQAQITDMHSLGECSACHGNHGVVRPTLAFLSPLPDTPCAFCHEGADAPAQEIHESAGARSHYEESIGQLLDRADAEGIPTGDELFDWLVDLALTLSSHTVTGAAEADGTPLLRPEFDRLFSKFRIGKTSYMYEDPATGEQARAPILRCSSCHSGEDLLGEDAHGARVAAGILERMRALTALTAQAERLQLAARRGGVETREAAASIDMAVDSQVQLEVLLHAFDVDEGSEFLATHEEGIAHVQAALEAGQHALDELAFRRRGLAIALVIILVVLIALGMKIREISVRDAAEYPGDSP